MGAVEEIDATAFHEAGHAVVARFLGIPVMYMTIYSRTYETTAGRNHVDYPHVQDSSTVELPDAEMMIGSEDVDEGFIMNLFPDPERDGRPSYGTGAAELDEYDEADEPVPLDEADEAYLTYIEERRQVALDWVERRILFTLAGPVAQEILTGEWDSEGAKGDTMNLVTLVEKTFGRDDPALVAPTVDGVADHGPVARRIKERWGDATRQLLNELWPWVETVAQEALDIRGGTLTGEAIDALRPDGLPEGPGRNLMD